MYTKKTEWLPDWRNESEYPDPKTASPQQWAWEFLRRNHSYQKDYARFDFGIVREIITQAKDGSITDETKQIFIRCLREMGKDCLTPWRIGQGKSTLHLPFYWDYFYNIENVTLWDFMEKLDSNTSVEIAEPASYRALCEEYGIHSVNDPAKTAAPLFSGSGHDPPMPVAATHCHGLIQDYLRPKTDSELTFTADSNKSIKEQLDYAKKMLLLMREKTNPPDTRAKSAKPGEWLRQLRLLDAEGKFDLNRQGMPWRSAKEALAEEWEFTLSNLSRKFLEAKKNRDSGYRNISAMPDPYLSGAEYSSMLLELTRSWGQVKLTNEKLSIRKLQLKDRALKEKALKNIKDHAQK